MCLGVIFERLGRLAQKARMFLLHALDGDFEGLEFVTVSYRDRFKALDFNAEFIDDSPGDHLLFGDPDASLFVIRFSEEKLQVQQVSKAAALENLDLNTG